MGTTASIDDHNSKYYGGVSSNRSSSPRKSKRSKKIISLTDKLTKVNGSEFQNSEDSDNTERTTPTVIDHIDKDETSMTGKFVSDESIHINIAMADLMSYLQVVANNSINLPLTRRDDPELGRTVSTLTGEEYSKKSAAFLPCDVRVIGGSYLGYNRVWDLPSSEEYKPMHAVKEPGFTHGGGCCNSMLKVLYDTEGNASDMMKEDRFMSSVNLFADDESVSVANININSFDSLLLSGSEHTSDISWAVLLRQMKTEMVNSGYKQSPTICSSRKIDLNAPFKLVPAGFDPKINKKRSLLIGCNYKENTDATLKSSHDDVRSMKDYIVNVHGFSEDDDLMTVLLDDDFHKPPTHHNIIEALKYLSEKSIRGDAVFVQFTGHGGRVLDNGAVGAEAECYDEIIVPIDYRSSGVIRDTLLFKTLLAPMSEGVYMNIFLDSSETGVMIDLPYAWSTKYDKPEALAKVSLNDDFSFLRFLKVVKSMYEMSTFTRLGNTVNSALIGKHGNNVEDSGVDEDDDESADAGSLVTVDDDKKVGRNGTGKNDRKSLLESITENLLTCGLLNNNTGADDDIAFNQKDSYMSEDEEETIFSDDGTAETNFDDFNERSRRRGMGFRRRMKF